eukprot:457802-Alexandrium_andersonii.AAC.1
MSTTGNSLRSGEEHSRARSFHSAPTSVAQSSRQRPLRLARRPGQALGLFTAIGVRFLSLRALVPLLALAAT